LEKQATSVFSISNDIKLLKVAKACFLELLKFYKNYQYGGGHYQCEFNLNAYIQTNQNRNKTNRVPIPCTNQDYLSYQVVTFGQGHNLETASFSDLSNDGSLSRETIQM
jgi:hypothetical protein